jgi:hypothetical protein
MLLPLWIIQHLPFTRKQLRSQIRSPQPAVAGEIKFEFLPCSHSHPPDFSCVSGLGPLGFFALILILSSSEGSSFSFFLFARAASSGGQSPNEVK